MFLHFDIYILYFCKRTDGNGLEPKWFDWSVGIKDQSPGSGLLDVNAQRIWYEAGTATSAVFPMSESKVAGTVEHYSCFFHYRV